MLAGLQQRYPDQVRILFPDRYLCDADCPTTEDGPGAESFFVYGGIGQFCTNPNGCDVQVPGPIVGAGLPGLVAGGLRGRHHRSVFPVRHVCKFQPALCRTCIVVTVLCVTPPAGAHEAPR